MKFYVEGQHTNGQSIKGIIECASLEKLKITLAQKGIIPEKIIPEQQDEDDDPPLKKTYYIEGATQEGHIFKKMVQCFNESKIKKILENKGILVTQINEKNHTDNKPAPSIDAPIKTPAPKATHQQHQPEDKKTFYVEGLSPDGTLFKKMVKCFNESKIKKILENKNINVTQINERNTQNEIPPPSNQAEIIIPNPQQPAKVEKAPSADKQPSISISPSPDQNKENSAPSADKKTFYVEGASQDGTLFKRMVKCYNESKVKQLLSKKQITITKINEYDESPTIKQSKQTLIQLQSTFGSTLNNVPHHFRKIKNSLSPKSAQKKSFYIEGVDKNGKPVQTQFQCYAANKLKSILHQRGIKVYYLRRWKRIKVNARKISAIAATLIICLLVFNWLNQTEESTAAKPQTATIKYSNKIKAAKPVKGYQKLNRFNEIKKTARQNDVKAQYQLAKEYIKGGYVIQDYDKALEYLIKAANKNHIQAQYELGQYYLYGKMGLKADHLTAISWFEKAANLGHHDATKTLVKIYSQGNGVPQNDKLADQWLLKIAHSTDPWVRNQIKISQYRAQK